MLSRLTPKERTYVWALAAIGFLSRLALAFRSDALLATRPYIEDSFYAFSCARQLALGHGFSVDGIHPTNGVQPLICLLYTPCFLLTSDKWLALRLTFVVTGLIVAFGVLMIAHLLSRLLTELPRSTERKSLWHSGVVIGAILWTISDSLLLHNSNGLETGLAAMLILAVLSYYSMVLEEGLNATRSVVLGVLLGLLVLARIDGAFFVIALIGYELYRSHGKHLPLLVITGGVAVAVSSPWWIYSYRTFGSFMPISGQSEALGSQVGPNLLQSWTTITDMASIVFHHPFYSTSIAIHLILTIIVAASWIWATRKFDIAERLSGLDLRPLLPLVLFSAALVVYYNFFFNAPHFIPRYLHPLRILIVLLFCLIWSLISPSVVRMTQGRKGARIGLAVVAVASIAFNFQRYVYSFSTSTISELYLTGKWAESVSSSRIGMDQSGTAHFVSDNVVNLDGKVNPDALHARQLHRKGAYIAAQGFDYLADWDEFAQNLVFDARSFGQHYTLIDSIGKVRIYQRQP